MFNIKRDYVDLKNGGPDGIGEITFTRTEKSKIPKLSIEAIYKKY